MATISEDGWETDPESGSESDLQDIKKYDTASKKERGISPQQSETKAEDPTSKTNGTILAPCKELENRIRDDPDQKLSFVIFRTTYKSQEKWDRFMEHMNERTRLNFQEENAVHLFDHVDWCVQEDPSLARASAARIRREFKRWFRESGEKDHWLGSARFMACVMIDEASLNRVLKGPPASDIDADRFGAVRLVSLDKEENEMFAGLSFLVPRIFGLLQNCGWDNFVPREGEYVACP